MGTPQIVRITERSKGALLERNLLGLNIFWANDVESSIANDPQVAFLSGLCGRNDAALNVGNLFDYADSPEELFDGTDWESRYRTVATGCYGGVFYDARKWNTFPPLFLESVSESFFQLMTNGDGLTRKLLQIDAVAYFISPKGPDSAKKLEVLLNGPFESSEALIERSLAFFKLVGFSHADGDYFSFASRRDEDFSVIEEPLSYAVNLIESSNWYRENASSLTWDEGYSECLMKVRRK
jgi:hypothetical protein